MMVIYQAIQLLRIQHILMQDFHMVLCQKNGIRKSNPDAAKKSYLITKQCEIE